MEKPILIVAFDIEARGKSPRSHGILAVGVVLGKEDGSIILEKEWRVAPLPGQHYETRTHQELKARLERDTIGPMSFSTAFRAMLDCYEREYTLYLLSDNPTFDAGFINAYLDLYDLDSMQYEQNGTTYRLVHDADEYARGVNGSNFNDQWATLCTCLGISRSGERHSPVDDARDIFRTHVAVVRQRQKI
jgi:hypothetical protein